MRNKPENSAIAASLVCAVFLWGANNVGTKYLVRFWPPLFIGSGRMMLAGGILIALMRWTPFFGVLRPISHEIRRRLWWQGGASLAIYILAFNWALKLTAVSHVALYIGASPVWALLFEGRPRWNWPSAQRYGAAALALMGVIVLFLPLLHNDSTRLLGEMLGMASSVLWANYGRQCRGLAQQLSGMEMCAHIFWRAGCLLAPFGAVEFLLHPPHWRTDLGLIFAFCILGGAIAAFALWNSALRHWKTSQVYLFTNLIPLSTMTWAHLCLGEPITPTFWFAMLLIAGGVFLGQTNWQALLGARWAPLE